MRLYMYNLSIEVFSSYFKPLTKQANLLESFKVDLAEVNKVKKKYSLNFNLFFILILMLVGVLTFDAEALVFSCLFLVFIILISFLNDIVSEYFETEMVFIFNRLIQNIFSYRIVIFNKVFSLLNYIKILDLIMILYYVLKLKIEYLIHKNYKILNTIYIYIFQEYFKFLLKEEILIWKLIYIFNLKRKFLFIRLFLKLNFVSYSNLKNTFVVNEQNNVELFYYLYESFYILNIKNNRLN